jgi:hypothetical protein
MTIPTPASEADVDGLLRAFFQSEMPARLPPIDLPAPRRAPRRRPLARSRLALAACAALLVGGSLFLGGQAFERKAPEEGVSAPSADLRFNPVHRRAVEPQMIERLIQKPDGTYIQIEVIESADPAGVK